MTCEQGFSGFRGVGISEAWHAYLGQLKEVSGVLAVSLDACRGENTAPTVQVNIFSPFEWGEERRVSLAHSQFAREVIAGKVSVSVAFVKTSKDDLRRAIDEAQGSVDNSVYRERLITVFD